MIEENAGNPIANQKKALRVKKLFQDTNRALNTFRAASNKVQNK
jgi:hypothetical protein